LWAFRLIIGAAFLVGLLRLVRRFRDKAVRLISTADDYFSLILVILFFGSAFLALLGRFQRSEALLLAFYGVTAVFLVYEPFSKIIHYLYFPFAHFFLGRSLGHRGVYPLRQTASGPKPGPHPPEAD
jgi:nitrate reductase gamma subunit